MREDEQRRLFTELFETHADELFRHCVYRLSDRERALELTQEVFVRAWEYVARGGAVREFRPFLYRILNNLIVDEYRRHASQSLDALLEDDGSATAANELLRDPTDALEAAMVRFESVRVLRALAKLSEAYRAVIIFKYIDGLSVSEIAHATGENENTISVRIHRALKKLKALLEPRTP